MKLMIEPPTWLGDAVMATGAIKKLINNIQPKEVVYFGSPVALALFPNEKKIIDDRKHRIKQFFKLPKVDLFVSFRSSLYSKALALKYGGYTYSVKFPEEIHMVERYNIYINHILKKNLPIYKPTLPFKPKKFTNPTFGIHPGAAYGNSKRWYPKEFAKVANFLGKYGDIIIFGGPGEEKIAREIEENLKIKNYKNLCGKLSIKELCEYIGGLSGFISNDSGPMHISAAYNVPTVGIFGPTSPKVAYPYCDKNLVIYKDIECSPCYKRECPLKHHNCMKMITAEEVIYKIQQSKIFPI